MKATLNDKKLGMIYGVLIGDALGSQYEFYSKHSIEKVYKNQNNMIDFYKEKTYLFQPWAKIYKNVGELSDDGQMTMALLHHLVNDKQKNPSIEPYVKWYNLNPNDVGLTTAAALSGGQLNWESESNGAMMRISPWMLLADKLSPDQLFSRIHIDISYTHPNRMNILYTLSYCILLNVILSLSSESTQENVLRCSIAALFDILKYKFQVKEILEMEILFKESILKKPTDYLNNRGWAKIALQNAIYRFFNEDSYEEALENTILEGGDTDTNCCIFGALWGAMYGINMIPKDWVSKVKNAKSHLAKEYEPNNIEELIQLI